MDGPERRRAQADAVRRALKGQRFPRSGITSPARPEAELDLWLIKTTDGGYYVLLGVEIVGMISPKTAETLRTAVRPCELLPVVAPSPRRSS
jgi:hypothetical protein